MKKILIIHLVIMNILFGSRFWGMISSDGTSCSWVGGNFSKLEDQLNVLKSQSNTHDTSWGLIYYVNGEIIQTSDTTFGPIYRELGPAYNLHSKFDSLVLEIKITGLDENSIDDLSDDVNGSIAHLRLATAGADSIPDPHPFVMEFRGKTWSFAHNGTLDKNTLLELVSENWMVENNIIPQTFEEFGYGGDWQMDEGFANVVDSELYFFWIMKNIRQVSENNIINGIHNALSHPDFVGITNLVHNHHANFVLSNGKEMWSFRRNGEEENNSDNYRHTVYWKQDTNEGADYKAVMSQVYYQNLWNELGDHHLVYLPSDGAVVELEDFDLIENEIKMSTFHSGWNWVGFPLLLDNEDGIVGDNPDPVEDIFNLVEDEINYIKIENQVDSINYHAIWEYLEWNTDSDLTEIVSTKGYKVKLPEDQENYYIPIIGARVPADTPIDLVEGENWVPYFITKPQRFIDAFPENVLDKIQTIKSENWFIYKNSNGQFIMNQYCPEMYMDGGSVLDCYNLYYGSMVEVVVDEDIQLIWNNPGGGDDGTIDPLSPLISEKFPFKKKSDYIPLVIESFDSENEIEEIGAKKSDKYVGAEFVGGFPVNMRVYDNNLADITFEIAGDGGGLGRLSDKSEIKQMLGISQSRVENGVVFVQLSDIGNNPIESPSLFSLVKAYPNPMNPGIEIHFSLMKDAKVELDIYDILGRKLTTLVRGNLISGNHSYQWNGIDEKGTELSSGIYLYLLQSDDEVIQNKIILLK